MIDLATVIAVLFPTGWESITPGSFEAVELDYGASGPPAEDGFRYLDQSSEVVYVRLAGLLAVRCSA